MKRLLIPVVLLGSLCLTIAVGLFHHRMALRGLSPEPERCVAVSMCRFAFAAIAWACRPMVDGIALDARDSAGAIVKCGEKSGSFRKLFAHFALRSG